MKATELMVGDWVNFLVDTVGGETREDPMTNEYQPMQIVSLSSWRNNDGDVESAEGVINDIDQVKPIHLTDEILKKNGFSLQSDNTEFFKLDTYCFGNELCEFLIHRLNNEYYQFGPAKIRNVHELQHAMRLCGIEKEVEL